MEDTLLLLPDFKTATCPDPCHECYGMQILIADRIVNKHEVHVEFIVDGNWCNVKVDNKFHFHLSLSEAKQVLQEETL